MSYIYNKKVEVQNPVSLFSEQLVVNRTPIFEIVPTKGKSEIRDIEFVTGSSSITQNISEIVLSTGTTLNSNVALNSAERGRYMAGYGGNIGLGLRFDANNATLTGNGNFLWGYGANNNTGLFFGRDVNGIFTSVRRNGVEIEKTYQTNWNIDKADGTGQSGINLNLVDGNIYQIDYSWYGYGDIEFCLVDRIEETQRQAKITVHVFRPTGNTSIEYPNLPIRVFGTNGNQADDLKMYVAGRQYSVYGPFEPNNRLVTEYKLNKGTDGTMRPIISAKSKSTASDLSIAKKFDGFDIFPTSEDILVEVRVNTTVSNTQNFQIPTGYSNNEIATIFDTTANTVTGGVPLWYGLVSVSASRGNQPGTGARDKDGLFITIPEDYIITISCRTISGNPGTVSAVMRIREEW